jgi:hypothetical protein
MNVRLDGNDIFTESIAVDGASATAQLNRCFKKCPGLRIRAFLLLILAV